jgi:hypothetical protein
MLICHIHVHLSVLLLYRFLFGVSRDSKVSQLLRESLGNTGCHTSMIAQVSPLFHHYNETLQVVQLAARIHRMRRRRLGKTPGVSTCSCSQFQDQFMRNSGILVYACDRLWENPANVARQA